MDSYSKDLHLRDKDYVPDIPNNELSSLEGDHQESGPRFGVDEPLEVQLRFDLGSLVDAQVLLDTHGPRESHWDFMRQEQGRFQTSSEENTALLVHDKQDDLKAFDNCEGWPRSTQMDTQLFIDAHDDVCMITEAFEGKEKSIAQDRSLLLSSYRHREEAAAWIGEDKKALEGKAQGVHNSCREGTANGTIGASPILLERPDTRGACDSSAELGPHPEDAQVQTNENNENQEIEQSASDLAIEPLEQMKTNEKNENQEVEWSASDLVIEPLVNLEQRTEDKAASRTVSEPQYRVLPDASVEAEVKQELSLDSSNGNRAISVQPDASTIDDLEVSAQTKKVILAENVNGQTMDAQASRAFEEQSKVSDLATKVDDKTIFAISESIEKGTETSNVAEELQETGTAPAIHSHVIFGPTMDAQDSDVVEDQSKMTTLETKVRDEIISAISESMAKDNETGHTSSNVAEEMQETGTAPDVHSHATFGHTSPNLDTETPDMKPEEMTGTAPVIHSHVNFGHTSPNLEKETPDKKPETGVKQSTPGGSCPESESTLQTSEGTVMPDSDEKQSASGLPCSTEDFISQGSEGVTTSNISMSENSKETSIPSIDNVDGMIITAAVSSFRDSDEAECKARDGLDPQAQTTYRRPGIEQADTNLAGEKGVAAMELLTVEQQVICLESAASALKQDAAEVCTASALEQDAADVCTGARRFENTSMCNNMEQEENTQGIDSVADLSLVTPDTLLKETTTKKISETTKVSVVHDDSLKLSDYRMQFKDHAAEESGNSGQEDQHKDAISNVLTVEHTSLRYKSIIEKSAAKGVDKGPRQYGSTREASIQELSVKYHSGDQSASGYSISSAKPNLLSGENISAESTLPGGVLHVLLDVHKEAASDDSVPKDQEHVQRIASKILLDVQTFNTSDATRDDFSMAGEVAAGFSDTYVSGLTGMAATSGSLEDEQLASNYTTPPQDKVSKRKSDPGTRNNRLKDSARASPLQVRSDQEQKSAGKGLGKRKTSSPAQKKGIETLEAFSSPKKSGSKTASGKKKGISPPMVQDATVSPVAKEVVQTPANISKTVLSVNARQHGVPDLNGSDTAVPMTLPAQPFSEPQQVQLRAQILVYGSLIQGTAPEEALMIAAFSNVTGAPVRNQEASGRAVWEKQWQAAVERIHAKSSRETLRDSRGSGFLVSNLPGTSVKASEGDLKANNSPGFANSLMDARNVAGLHARAADIPGTKGHPSRPRQSADAGFGISVSRSNQSAAVIVPPGPSLLTALHSVSSPLSENLTQSSKTRVDVQQITPQTYYPAPPLGPFLAGAPQWLPTATFSGPWQPQTPAAVYNTPSTLFTHAQAVVNSDQAPEMRRNTLASSGPTVSVNPIIPTLFTPIVGPLAGTPTPAADPVQKTQPMSESRPRKRKQTQSETYVSATDVMPNAPFMVGSQATAVSDFPAGQAGIAISSPVNLPSLTAPESLAMVVVNTQIPKTSQEAPIATLHANKVSAPNLTNMLNVGTPVPAVEHRLDKSVSLQNSTSQLAQAQRSAEEAALVAASAVRESESLWSQLKAKKNSGLTSDIEMQLVSSALAVATAASVAKAAAAAAKAAYEAAVQAKMISEDALGCGKQGDEPESFRLLQDNAWGMPESCNSIIAAAKVASKKRLQAVSAARMRAQNFDSVVRAAELASNAVTQVGSVMGMGESVPFTLEMLMEAGPEGFHRLLSLATSGDKDKTMAKGTGPQSPGKKGTPKQKDSIEKVKRPSKKISCIKEASIQRETQVDSWTTDSVMPARPENDARMNADLSVGLMTELNKQKTNDQLEVYVQASRQGLPPIRTEDELMMQQPEDSIIDNQIVKGSPVEVMSDEKGLRGVWFSARAQNVDGGKVFVLYDDLLSDDGFCPLEEWIQLKGSSSKAPRVRLAHPSKNIGFEGTRKRRREAMGSHKWSVGDGVDAWMRDGWWEGEIKEIIEDGDSKAKVFFPGDGDTSLVKTSKLRPSLVWSNGHWVLWTDAKQGKNDPSKVRSDPHEGETPIAKRQKSEKGQASNVFKQKPVGSSIVEIAATQKEGSLLDSAATKSPTDFKSFAVGGIDKSKSQGSKVVFGVPRPMKKRKLIEVSKHFGSARGARNTSTPNVKATSNKHEEAMNAVLGFVTGSSEVSRLDGLKAKKRVLPSQKAKSKKDADSERSHSKGNAIRNKKEKPFVDTKALVRKNPSSREGLPSVSKNKEGKFIGKKKLPSDKPDSQKQPEGVPSGDALLQKLSAASGATSSEVNKNTYIIQDEGGKEPSHAAQKTGKPSEKQTVHAVKETGREPSHMVQASDSKQTSSHSVKEREKQSFQQPKDGEKQPPNLVGGNRQSSKKKETQPSVAVEGNEELAQEKENGSQSVQEGERQLLSAEASREKQPASPVTDIEKHPPPPSKETDKGKDVGKSGSEIWEPRRTSRKIQPTSKLLEGLQTAPKLGKNSSPHDKGSRAASKAPPHL